MRKPFVKTALLLVISFLISSPIALSILGFNLGIDLMQLFVMALTIPWLMLLSRTPAYRAFRLAGAGLAALAAIGWVVERFTEQGNIVSERIDWLAGYAPFALAALACLALFHTWRLHQARQLPFS